ncbi:MAG: GDSL-type esterase/lipase family protein [Bacteroidales bacterium]
MPFGNSITEGTDGDPPAESQRIAYRYTLYSLLTSAGYDFDFVGHRYSGYGIFPDADHAGIPGTRDQYLVRLLQDGYDERWDVQITPNSQPYLDVYPADIILLHIGTNDITHGEGASPESVSQILDEIDTWEARTSNEVIVLVARILNRKTYNLTTTQYNNNVAAMVASRDDPNIHMVDIENGAGIDYEADMQDDGIHPYESGYNKMGQKWFEAIQSLNKPPYFTSTPITTATEDVTYSYEVAVDDDNPLDALTIIAGSKPGWLTFTDNGDKTGLLSGIPGDDDVGPHSVSLIVSDGKEIAAQEFTITVENVNDPPQITGQYDMETDEDVSYTISTGDLIIEDVDNDPADIRLIVRDGENYTVKNNTVHPQQDYYGTLLINIQATDQVDTSETYQASLDVIPVNDPPVIIGQRSDLKVKQFSELTISTSDLHWEDIDNNVNDLSVFVHPDPDTIFTVNDNRITPIKDTVGPVDVKIQLDDGEDTSNEFLLQVDVLAPFSPPVFTTTPPMEAIVKKGYFYVVGATDPDEGDTLTYRATTLPDWLDFNPELKLLGGNPSIEDTGLVWVGLEVTDGRYSVEQLYQLEVKLSTGIADPASLQQSGTGLIENVYPVPVRDQLYLFLVDHAPYQIQLIDISGRIVHDLNIQNSIGSPVMIDMAKNLPGVYYLRVSDGMRYESRKIMVVK